VVYGIITFLHIACKKLAMDGKKNVGQTPRLVDVAKDFSCLRWSFVTPNMH
jgi:hypothetical protein